MLGQAARMPARGSTSLAAGRRPLTVGALRHRIRSHRLAAGARGAVSHRTGRALFSSQALRQLCARVDARPRGLSEHEPGRYAYHGLMPADPVLANPERLDRIPLAVLILANLAPAVGVLFFGWDAHYLLLLYWLENLVVGGWTLLRMLHAGGLRVLPQSAFFSFHYSFFCAGHGIFILTLTDLPGEAPPEDFADEGFVLLMPFRMLASQFGWIANEMP